MAKKKFLNRNLAILLLKQENTVIECFLFIFTFWKFGEILQPQKKKKSFHTIIHWYS
jgi:hypothetical protein